MGQSRGAAMGDFNYWLKEETETTGETKRCHVCHLLELLAVRLQA